MIDPRGRASLSIIARFTRGRGVQLLMQVRLCEAVCLHVHIFTACAVIS